MTFTDITSAAAVFLDANVLVYAATRHPIYGVGCQGLLDRIEHQDVKGFTSTGVLADVAHRTMTLEACDRFGWPAQGVANRLRRHPSEVRQRVVPRRAVDDIVAALGLVCLPSSPPPPPQPLLAGPAGEQQFP